MTPAKKDSKSATGHFGFGTQIRKSPYFDATVRWGASGFSVYNHMYIPRDFGDPVQNFWNLVNAATLSDVAVERRVEITGHVDRKMVINALNSTADVFMADFEDSASPTWATMMEGQLNLIGAAKGSLHLKDDRGKE